MGEWSRVRTVGLTAVCVGLQFNWALMSSVGTPLLRASGVPLRYCAYVWLCGPLAGLIAQPVVGWAADTWRVSRWGRRTPWLCGGLLLAIAALAVIPNAPLMVAGVDARGDALKNDVSTGQLVAIAVLASVGFWILSFAVNGMMDPMRALIADLLPPHLVGTANGSCAALCGAGALMSAGAGLLPLGDVWPPLGVGFRGYTILAALVLALSCAATVLAANERAVYSGDVLGYSSGEDALLINPSAGAALSLGDGSETERAPARVPLRARAAELWAAVQQASPRTRALFRAEVFVWFAFMSYWVYSTVFLAHTVAGGSDDAARNSPGERAYARGIRYALVSYAVGAGAQTLTGFAVPAAMARWRIPPRIVYICGALVLGVAMAVPPLFTRHSLAASAGILALVPVALGVMLAVPYTMVLSEPEGQAAPGTFMGVVSAVHSLAELPVALVMAPILQLTHTGSEPAIPLLVGGAAALVGAAVACFIPARPHHAVAL